VIRLAVRGDESTCQDVALRLRGASLADRLAADRATAPPDGCDAVVFLESRESDADLMDRCLTAGKHVLLTPRPWLSGDVLERLAAPKAAQLDVANPDRFAPSRQVIRQVLDEGKLGAPGLIRAHRWESADAAGESPPAGVPVALASDVDLAVWWMGQPPNLVYALERAGDDAGRASGRLTQVHLGFPGGGMALLDYCDHLPAGDGYQSISLIGSRGAAYADDHQNMQLAYRGGAPRALRVDERGTRFAALVQRFVDALNAGHDLSADDAAWRTVLAVAEVIRRSIASGQAIPFGEAST
jgi:predicted dehydrogenase